MNNYKVVKYKDKDIAYPKDMNDSLIEVLESTRKNNSFINIVYGDVKSGKSWGEINDTKGMLKLSEGRDYYFPLLVSFSEKYEDLHEKSFKNILKYLEDNNIDNIDEVLSSGGGILTNNIVAIMQDLKENKVVYKHDSFEAAYDLDTFKIQEEQIKKTIIESSNIIGDKQIDSQIIRHLITYELDGELGVFSRHDSKEDAESFLETLYENNFEIYNKENKSVEILSFDF